MPRWGESIKIFPERLVSFRESLAVAGSAMARAFGVPQSTYDAWERGRFHPSRDMFLNGLRRVVSQLSVGDEAVAFDRALAHLLGADDGPWGGPTPGWKDGCNPSIAPGPKRGAPRASEAGAVTAKAIVAVVSRLASDAVEGLRDPKRAVELINEICRVDDQKKPAAPEPPCLGSAEALALRPITSLLSRGLRASA